MADLDMFERLAGARRSVRAFLPEPVPDDLIERVIGIAGMAPSSCNVQPWHLHVVSGPILVTLRTALLEAASAGRLPDPDFAPAPPYSGIARERQIDAAVRLFAAQGIERHDRDGRTASYLRNYAFFDAPHAAFLLLPAHSGPRETADAGLFVQTFLLALTAAGIGSCVQGSLAEFPTVVRDLIDVADNQRLLLGISFGYPDPSHRTADVRTDRASFSAIATFHN